MAHKGLLQSHGTCWLYSILNGFLLSTDGQKILFYKLKMFLKKLTVKQMAFMNSPEDAVYPKDISKVNLIYFYKFIDQFLCFHGGPSKPNFKTGRSPELLRGLRFRTKQGQDTRGFVGADPMHEIGPVLNHIGMRGSYGVILSGARIEAITLKQSLFIMIKNDFSTPLLNIMPYYDFLGPSYNRMCASFTFGRAIGANPSFHAIAGFMDDGVGYIYDSHKTESVRCDWWKKNNLKAACDEIGKKIASIVTVDFLKVNYVLYSRKQVMDSIAPSCRLNPKTPIVSPYTRRVRYFPVIRAKKVVTNKTVFENVKRRMRESLYRTHKQQIYRNWHRKFAPANRKLLLGEITHAATNKAEFERVKTIIRQKRLMVEKRNVYSQMFRKFAPANRKKLREEITLNSRPKGPYNTEVSMINKAKTMRGRAIVLSSARARFHKETYKLLRQKVRAANALSRKARANRKALFK